MEEDNKYIKRQKIYKIIMLMILTAFVTSILTAIYSEIRWKYSNN